MKTPFSTDTLSLWLQEMEQLADQYANAKAHRTYLEDYKKSVLAMVMGYAERSDPQKYSSNSAQETYARRSEQYQKVLKDLHAAVYNEEKAKAALKRREIEFECWRTNMANERAAMSRYGHVA